MMTACIFVIFGATTRVQLPFDLQQRNSGTGSSKVRVVGIIFQIGRVHSVGTFFFLQSMPGLLLPAASP